MKHESQAVLALPRSMEATPTAVSAHLAYGLKHSEVHLIIPELWARNRGSEVEAIIFPQDSSTALDKDSCQYASFKYRNFSCCH